MAITYITVKGFVKNGELKLDLPENVADGEVELWVAITQEDSEASQPEAGKLLDETLQPGQVGGGADWYGGDSGAWMRDVMHERRRKRQTRLSES